ncbi:TRAP transporter solute receptor, TAXI family [Dethiosulfovibrio peptidovorans DSM 11002]|uniref:TRAP transporter solute receptor, TAXI family n=1 Tax=Dethiosulfovibrio peptidovorans DSM 11002 TaxID=469381 RepID=D2Z6T5_9BACT|nr:TAXI family TRAP transporter solute-binding subunit [Dethiosulfovibrio peptidovorans]EFC91182.1 TRAP transporter solute receptor, TAXI family [Dethiosulfovibrio peptidovorans DSM 11002]
MRKFLTALMVVGVLVMSVAGAASAKTFVSLATGGTGGTYYPVGGGLADLISRHLPDVQMTGETGNASVANLNLIGTHEIEMAFVQNDVAYWAYNGERMFKTPYKNIRLVASLYPEHIQCITLKGSGVKDIMDIKGKRVSVGAPGSGVQGDVSAILQVAGIKYADMNTDFLDFNNTTQRFKDGQLDVGFVTAGYPTSSIMDLATLHDIDLVSFSDEFMAELTETFSYFVKSSIPAGTYNGVDHDTPTPAVMAMWVCDADLPEDLIYRITKTFWENVEEMHKVHSKCKLFTLDTATAGASVPVHPGAAKFYKEAGIPVPDLK